MVSSLEASAKTSSHDQHHYFTSFTAIPLAVTFNHDFLVVAFRIFYARSIGTGLMQVSVCGTATLELFPLATRRESNSSFTSVITKGKVVTGVAEMYGAPVDVCVGHESHVLFPLPLPWIWYQISPYGYGSRLPEKPRSRNSPRRESVPCSPHLFVKTGALHRFQWRSMQD